MARFGRIFQSVDFRHAVVAYSGDGILQDRKLELSSPLTSDLVVGSVIDASGALIPDLSTPIAGVLVEPANAGDIFVVIAAKEFTILKDQALVFSENANRDAIIAAMASDKYRFASWAEFALPTT
ncbi:hypothetical protein JNO12_22785 [Erwinia aphidicola]|nr:hypothetical protein [Erwinia aphidicola]